MDLLELHDLMIEYRKAQQDLREYEGVRNRYTHLLKGCENNIELLKGQISELELEIKEFYNKT